MLKQDFKEKETKLLSDFSKLKTLKNKLEDKLYRQDLSKQAFNMMIKHIRFSDEHSVNIIGDPSPNYCKKAIEAQSSIYDGNVLLEPIHDPPCVESSDETLKCAEVSRDKMIEKMNDPKSVAKRVVIKPHDYDKENFESVYQSTLSSFKSRFKPQTNLTPQQVFWALDMEKRKAEKFTCATPILKVVPSTTVYPPNTPSHIVPRSLPTKCKMLISMYVLQQLFADFDKICKKKITPTGITEGERGFEQTKRCYLTEVIPFFNLLKELFVVLSTHWKLNFVK